MLGTKIAYLILLIGAFLFFVLYRGDLSLILLILSAIFPVILRILLFIHRLMIQTTLSVSSDTVTKGSMIDAQIHLKNRAFLPVPYVAVKYSISNPLFEKTENNTIITLIPPRNERIISVEFSSEYCGLIHFAIQQITFLDYIRLWKSKQKINLETDILVLPQIWPIVPEPLPATNLPIESDTFSDRKSGDDPSEVFAFREYRPGDAQSRIHWKLSTKRDDLVVKEYSLPIIDSACLLVDWRADLPKRIQTVAETTLSVSDALHGVGLAHTIAWYYPAKQTIQIQNMKDPDDTAVVTRQLLSGAAPQNQLPAWALFEPTAPIAHLFYITSRLTDADLNGISAITAQRKTILFITQQTVDSTLPFADDIDLIPVFPENPTHSIQELFI